MTNEAHAPRAEILHRVPAVLARTGLTRQDLYRAISAGRFPPPVKVGARASAWRDSDIAAWQAGLAVGVGVEPAGPKKLRQVRASAAAGA